MSRAEDIAGKAARLRARSSAGTEISSSAGTEISTSVPAARTVRTRPVRLTVDVPPAEHAALRRLCLDLTDELADELDGRASVSGQDVLRALLAAALHEPAARARLVEHLRGTSAP